jgi:hypothetical protein
MERSSVTGRGSAVLPWKRLTPRSKGVGKAVCGINAHLPACDSLVLSCQPMAAATLVLPTSPLPLKSRIQIRHKTTRATRGLSSERYIITSELRG